jgi:DNA-binding GntR family transcriptional regulator
VCIIKGKNSAVLGDFVYDQLKEMILTRKIRCGEKIQEQQIEKLLNVSRTPVREAVRKLSNEGIVILYPNRYAEVITFTEESIKELGMVRITMDCLAAQQAIQNGSNRDFDELKDLVKLCDEAHENKDFYQQIQYDAQFHMKLINISKNTVLIDILNNLLSRTQLLQTTIEDFSTRCEVKNHHAILDELYARNRTGVLTAVQNHLCPFYHLEIEDINSIIFK